jgi:hypothetical protein
MGFGLIQALLFNVLYQPNKPVSLSIYSVVAMLLLAAVNIVLQ